MTTLTQQLQTVTQMQADVDSKENGASLGAVLNLEKATAKLASMTTDFEVELGQLRGREVFRIYRTLDRKCVGFTRIARRAFIYAAICQVKVTNNPNGIIF